MFDDNIVILLIVVDAKLVKEEVGWFAHHLLKSCKQLKSVFFSDISINLYLWSICKI